LIGAELTAGMHTCAVVTPELKHNWDLADGSGSLAMDSVSASAAAAAISLGSGATWWNEVYGMQCTLESTVFGGVTGLVSVGAKLGRLVVGGGISNALDVDSRSSAFIASVPSVSGPDTWQCQLGMDSPGSLTCVAQTCSLPRGSECTTVEAAGVGEVKATLPAGYTMLSGGVRSRWLETYQNATANWTQYGHYGAFVHSKPHGENAWDCAIGVEKGSGLDCYVRGCKVRTTEELDCRTVLNANDAAGITRSECPTGFIATGCGMTNRFTGIPLTNRHMFQQAVLYKGSSNDRNAEGCECDMGEGLSGLITCHVRCCKIQPSSTYPTISEVEPVPPNTTCSDCPVGKYMPYYGTNSCLDCEEGKTTVSPGSVSNFSCV